jgi:hypothetical protein
MSVSYFTVSVCYQIMSRGHTTLMQRSTLGIICAIYLYPQSFEEIFIVMTNIYCVMHEMRAKSHVGLCVKYVHMYVCMYEGWATIRSLHRDQQ